VETGTRIRLSSQGEVGPGGGPAGDLYVEFRQRPHDLFTRKGNDLYCTMHVPMTAAALGTVLDLDTLDGTQQVDLRPGTQPSQIVTLRGLGVGRLRGAGRGDLHVQVEVEIPQGLNEEQTELLQALAKLRDEEHPEPRLSAANPGVFGRLRDKLSGR